MADYKRQTAVPVRISTLRNGEYVRQEGWEPNFVRLDDGQTLSRVNIMAVVISQPEELQVEVDDGSARLLLRQFEPAVRLGNLQVGDPVLIIGRPREFEREIYVIPEIVKKLKDPAWLKKRQEMAAEPLQTPEGPQQAREEIAPDNQEAQSFREQYETIYNLIRQMDDGKGADMEEVIQSAKVAEGEKIIKQLILEGEVFELTPGMLKVLQ